MGELAMRARRGLKDVFLTEIADTIANLWGLWEEIHTEAETGRRTGRLTKHQAHRSYPLASLLGRGGVFDRAARRPPSLLLENSPHSEEFGDSTASSSAPRRTR
jgi:hypothetical protein